MIAARRMALGLGAALALVLSLQSKTLLADEGPLPEPSAVGAATEGGEHAAGEVEHRPTPDDINYYYGMVGEKEGVEPGLLWRPKGMPVPYAAQWLNFALLFGAAYAFGKNRVRAALVKRKSTILHGIEEASKMREAAEARLTDYEDRLEHIDKEIERITQQMRESGEAERERILGEARDRRERMERDAQILIDQELKATREQLFRETVRGAVRSAERALLEQVNVGDQQRVARDYLDAVRASATQLRGKI
jgi:F-type H+-transporting ATPase subunit b